MKRSFIILCILFLASCTKNSDVAKDTLVELDKDAGIAEVFQYVSYVKQGDGSGNSPKNAADFLSAQFWEKIGKLIMTAPVRVLFAEGDYSRAYTEKALVLNNIGNSQNKLILEGADGKTIFSVPENFPQKSVLFDIRNSRNIHVKNISFTGSGLLGYALRITSDVNKATKDILIENCSWIDMHGIIYGGAGAHQEGTSYVTFLNCTFKRIGIDSHSHHIYNAYGPSHVSVIDSHFEDCTGDYVRFRDNMDYGIIKGSTFIRSPQALGRVFISVPVFNDINPGDEYLATDYSFTNNSFINNASTNIDRAIIFYHMGFTPPGRNYLLTAEEGNILQTGAVAAKKALLLSNFGIDADKVRVSGNTYSSTITTKVALGAFSGYGSVSKGFSDWGDITNVVNDSNMPFAWEIK